MSDRISTLSKNSIVFVEDIQKKPLDELRDCLLRNLEARVGDRDKGMVLLETIFDERPYPVTVTRVEDGEHQYKIYLTKGTEQYPQQRFFQISWHVVHLLKYSKSSTDFFNNTNLESGFAAFNSVVECKRLYPLYDAIAGIMGSKYEKAYNVLCKLGEDNVFGFVKKIREKGSELSGYNNEIRELIQNDYPNIWSNEEVEFLLSKSHTLKTYL